MRLIQSEHSRIHCENLAARENKSIILARYALDYLIGENWNILKLDTAVIQIVVNLISRNAAERTACNLKVKR